MAISVDWQTKVITVPQADLTLVSGSNYELDLNTFRLALKALEDDEEGIPFPTTHNHNTEVEVAGITLARVIEIINGYTVTFEDGAYSVTLTNANSNVFDVTNPNTVNVRTVLSAGLTSDVGAKVAEDILNTDVSTLTDKTKLGGWLHNGLLSTARYLGLK